MSEQAHKHKIEALETYIMECKKEIEQIEKNNEKYFLLMQNFLEYLIEKDKAYDEYYSNIQDVVEIKNEIIDSKKQMSTIQNNLEKTCDRFEKCIDLHSKNLNLFHGLEDQDIITELKEMMIKIHQLIKQDENCRSCQFNRVSEDKTQKNITFKELQDFANLQNRQNHCLKPDSKALSYLGIPQHISNINPKIERFTSKHVKIDISNRDESRQRTENPNNYNVIEFKENTEEQNVSKDDPIEDPKRKNNWLHMLLK